MDKVIILLFIAHLLGDFIFQSEWMAISKCHWFNDSDGIQALTYHVITYTLVLFLSFILCTNYPIYPVCIFVLCNSILHFITDAITSQVTSHYHETGERRKFFNTIGLDQTIHYVTLYITYYYILFLSVKHA